MADDMKELRRRKAVDESGSSTEGQPKKKTKLRRYVVRKGHKISVKKGEYISGGTEVLMDSKMAKHYIKHDCIAPYVDFDDDDEDE